MVIIGSTSLSRNMGVLLKRRAPVPSACEAVDSDPRVVNHLAAVDHVPEKENVEVERRILEM